jgi:membrane protease subunit HflK
LCCLVPTGALLLLLSKLLSLLAWSDTYENYSFLLDHLALISGFFSGLVIIFFIVAALRLALDRAFKNISGEQDTAPARWRTLLAGFCGTLIRILDLAYLIAFGVWLVLFISRNWAQYSPLQFYRYYREENFQYPLRTFAAVLGLGLGACTLSVLFKAQKLLKTISCAAGLHNVFQTLGAMALCAAIAIAGGGRAGPSLAAECFISAGCLYISVGLLRGLGRDMLRGNLTGTFAYRPLLSLPEQLKIFDRSMSWEERTGLSFKSLWSLSYAARVMPLIVLAGCLMLLTVSSMYTIEPHQEALLYRLGSLRAGSVKSPGLHFKLPWPIDRADMYDVSRVKNMQIGYVPSASLHYLWDSEHGGTEYTLLLGGGSEMVAVNIQIFYSISNLYDYAIRYANGEDFLVSGMYAMLMRKTVPSDLDTILSVDRNLLSRDLTAGLSDYAESFKLGIRVNEVTIENIHPPIELADVYHGVIDSAIQKETLITQAMADAERSINDALRQKEEAVLTALTRQTEKTSLARREMAVYESAFLAHEPSPESYKLLKTTNFYQYLIQKEHLYVFSPGTMGAMDRYLITNGFGTLAEQEL